MNIILLGYGRMGHEIEQVASEAGHTVILRIDKDNTDELSPGNIAGADVAIDFTGPSSAPDIIKKALGLGLPVVSGSTGWNDRLEEIETYCKEHNGTFIHSSNFSIGVNILFHLNSELARIMRINKLYKVRIEEIHHIQKLDAPSGTAVTLAQEIIHEDGDYNGWVLEGRDNPEKDGCIPVKAVREGSVPGIHTVAWESDIDRISLRHEAKSRRGFAVGAVMAAEFVADKKGIFSMSDVLSF